MNANTNQHHHLVFTKIKHWLENIISLASQTRFIAIQNNNDGNIILCNDISRLCSETIVGSRKSNNNNNRNDVDVVEDEEENNDDDDDEQISKKERRRSSEKVLDRTLQIVSNWLQLVLTSNNSCNTTKNYISCNNIKNSCGKNSLLHWSLSISSFISERKFFGESVLSSEKLLCGISEVVSRIILKTREFLSRRTTTSEITHEKILSSIILQVSKREKIENNVISYFGSSSSSSSSQQKEFLLELFLARLCFHYHDGELFEFLFEEKKNKMKNSVGNHSYCVDAGFFLSLPNHASFLAVKCLSKLLLVTTKNIEEEKELNERDISASILELLSQRKRNHNDSNKKNKKVSKQATKFNIQTISVPFSSNSNSQPNVLSGLAFWLLPANYFMLSQQKKKEEEQEDETDIQFEENSSMQDFISTSSFRNECGFISSSFLQMEQQKKSKIILPVKYSSSETNNNVKISFCLIQNFVGVTNANFSSDSNWIEMISKACKIFVGEEKENVEQENTLKICFLPANSSSLSVTQEFLATICEKVKNLIFVKTRNFNSLAIELDNVPSIVNLKKKNSSTLHFYELNNNNNLENESIHVNLFYAAIPPDTFDSRKKVCGILLQLTSCSSFHNYNNDSSSCATSSSTVSSSFSTIINRNVTVIFYRRLPSSQLSALHDIFNRVVSHLIACLNSNYNTNNHNDKKKKEDETSSSLMMMIRGGGTLDCLWIATLDILLEQEENCLKKKNISNISNNDDELPILEICAMLKNSLRSYLCALYSSSNNNNVSFIEDRISKCVFQWRNLILQGKEEEEEQQQKKINLSSDNVVVVGPLFSETQQDNNNDNNDYPIDTIFQREDSLFKAIEFSRCLCGFASIERSWQPKMFHVYNNNHNSNNNNDSGDDDDEEEEDKNQIKTVFLMNRSLELRYF